MRGSPDPYTPHGTPRRLPDLFCGMRRISRKRTPNTPRRRDTANTPNRFPSTTQPRLEKAIAQFRSMPHHAEFEPCPGVTAKLNYAGHILGSATVEIRGGDRTLVISGDLGRPDHPLLKPPDVVPAADAVVVESTYGDRERQHVGLDRLAAAVDSCLRDGGTVLIPAFAVDRTELVLKALHELMSAGRIPRVPIWLDSPMAASALQIYLDALTAGAPELRDLRTKDPFGLADVRIAGTVEESKALNNPNYPCVIVSASGMATGGRVVHHLAGLARAAQPHHPRWLPGAWNAGARPARRRQRDQNAWQVRAGAGACVGSRRILVSRRC